MNGIIKVERSADGKRLMVGDKTIDIITLNGEPLVTAAQVDKLHEKKPGTTITMFGRNIERFAPGVDVIKLDYRTRKDLHLAPTNSRSHGGNRGDMCFFTERGYLKLVKPYTDPLSWQIQDILIDCYFKVRDGAKETPAPASPPALPPAPPKVDEKVYAMRRELAAMKRAERVTITKDELIEYQALKLARYEPKKQTLRQPRTCAPLTDEKKAEILKLRNQHRSIDQISARTGVARTTVYDFIQRQRTTQLQLPLK